MNQYEKIKKKIKTTLAVFLRGPFGTGYAQTIDKAQNSTSCLTAPRKEQRHG